MKAVILVAAAALLFGAMFGSAWGTYRDDVVALQRTGGRVDRLRAETVALGVGAPLAMEARQSAVEGEARANRAEETGRLLAESEPEDANWHRLKAGLRRIFGTRTEEMEADMLWFGLRWPSEYRGSDEPTDFMDPVFNPAGKDLSEYDGEQLRQIEEDYAVILTELADSATDLCADALRDYIEANRFEWCLESSGQPTVPAVTPRESRSHYNRAANFPGWGRVAAIRFYSCDYPVFEDALREIARTKSERLSRLQAYMASLPGR